MAIPSGELLRRGYHADARGVQGYEARPALARVSPQTNDQAASLGAEKERRTMFNSSLKVRAAQPRKDDAEARLRQNRRSRSRASAVGLSLPSVLRSTGWARRTRCGPVSIMSPSAHPASPEQFGIDDFGAPREALARGCAWGCRAAKPGPRSPGMSPQTNEQAITPQKDEMTNETHISKRLRRVLLFACLAFAAVPVGSALGATKTVAQESATSPVAAANAQVRAAHASSAALELNVGLSVRNDAQLKAKIAAASTPGSPGYGHYLTKAQYMASYAPTDAQVAAVKSWLGEQGLQVTGASSDNLIVHVQGSTAAAQHGFGVSLNDYTAADGKAFYAPAGSPTVPADLAIDSVSGLSDYYKAVTSHVCDEEYSCGVGGPEIRNFYDITGNAEDETIAYVSYGAPLPQETYKQYAEMSGAPELKIGPGDEEIEFKQVGGALNLGEPYRFDAEVEETGDTESAYVVAPRAHHVYFLANENFMHTLETAEQEATESNAKVISNSWEIEDGGCPLAYYGMEKILEKAASLGKSVFFATGDNGAARGCSYPSASAYAIAVGGTRAEMGPSGEYIKETAVKDGGNCNNAIGRPSWQTGLGTVYVYPEGACEGRVTPDVSAISGGSEEEPWSVSPFETAQWVGEQTDYLGFGGTSLATPVWAAAAAVWNHENESEGRPGIGFLDPTLYALANKPTAYHRDFHDVTEGTNGFAARAGYDEATGWGTPIFHELNHNPSSLRYTGLTEGPAGVPTKLSATLDGEGGTALEHRVVFFRVAGQSCEGETDSSGVASCSVTIEKQGSYALLATFQGDAATRSSGVEATFDVGTPPPLFGKCLKVTNGFFKNSGCTDQLATATGKYEWAPGTRLKNGLSVAIKPLTTVKIETTGKHSLTCTGASGSGAITGEKTMGLDLTLTGCSDGTGKCWNTATEGEVRFPELKGTLGWLNKSLKKVDVALVGSQFAFTYYVCGGGAELVELSSTGILMSVSVDKSSTGTDKMSESKGKQSPNQLEGEEPRKFQETRQSALEGSIEEEAGMAASLNQKDEEAGEVNAVF